MAFHFDPPLTPRRGTTLSPLGMCRISTSKQDPKSLGDQKALLKGHLAGFKGDVRWEFLETTDSGEALDREDLTKLDELIRSRTIDVIVVEDLGRICRRIQALIICELCQDYGVRLIAINDNVDTARPGWKLSAFFAALRHETYNEDTGARIRRSARNRFSSDGTVATHVYGYIKPPGTKTDDFLQKDPAAEPIIEEWFRRLEGGATYAEIADWLNEQQIRPGPWNKSKKWDVAGVRRVTRNPILKGVRVHNERMSQRVNSTGRRRSVPAPPGERLERTVPKLAFIEPARYDRVMAKIESRNRKYARKGADGVDVRKDVSRKRTAWPGQHVVCGICGRPFYHGGHGNKARMMCSGAHNYKCWNAATFDSADAARRIADAILGVAATLPEFDAQFLGELTSRVASAKAGEAAKAADLGRRRKATLGRIDAVMNLLVDSPSSTALRGKLRELEAERDQIDLEQIAFDAALRSAAPLPPMDRIRAIVRDAFAGLAHDSAEFGRLMHRIVPRLEVRPVRLCDGGGVGLRAHIRLELAGLVPEARGLGDAGGSLARDLVVDLFELPQRARHLDAVRAMLGRGETQDQIASTLGITQAAVAHTAALARLMTKQGLKQPYVELHVPPDDLGRMKRHLHARYRFEPLPPFGGERGGDATESVGYPPGDLATP